MFFFFSPNGSQQTGNLYYWSATASTTDWNTKNNWDKKVIPKILDSPSVAIFNKTSYSNYPDVGTGNNVYAIQIGDNSFTNTAPLVISGSNFVVGNYINMYNGAGSAVILTPLQLNYPLSLINNSNNDLILSGILSGNNGISKSGTGNLKLYNNVYPTNFTIDNGSVVYYLNNAILSSTLMTLSTSGCLLDLGTFSATFSNLAGSGNINLNSGTLIVNSTTSSNFYGNISNSGTFYKTGSGTLGLGGSNNILGSTFLSGGTIQALSNTAISSGGFLTISSGTLDLNGNNLTSYFLNGGSSNGIITDNSSNSGISNFYVINLTGGSIANLITDGTNKKVKIKVASSTTGGNHILSNTSNTFSGGYEMTNNGRITLSSVTTSGTAGNIITCNLGRGPIIIGEAPTDKGQIYVNSSNLVVHNDIIYNTELGCDRPCAIRNDSTLLTLSGIQYANLSDVSFCSNSSSPKNINIGGKITGTNGLKLKLYSTGYNIVQLSAGQNVNDYAGNTTIESTQILQLLNSNQIPNGVGKGNLIIYPSGYFKLNNFSETINGLSGGGYVDSVSGFSSTLTVGDNNANIVFSGNIISTSGGIFNITKIGSGNFSMAGNNIVSGAMNLSAGTFICQSNSALSVNASLNQSLGSILDLNGYDNQISNLYLTSGIITDNSSGSGTTQFTINTLNATGYNLSGLFKDGTNKKLKMVFNNPIGNVRLLNNDSNYSGGTILKNNASGTRIVLTTTTVPSGTQGNIYNSVFGTGPIFIGENPTDKAQIYVLSTNQIILNPIVFNTLSGASTNGAIRLDDTGLVLGGTLCANLANIKLNTNVGNADFSLCGNITGPYGLTLDSKVLTAIMKNVTTSANDFRGDIFIGTSATLIMGATNQIPSGQGFGNVFISTLGTLQLSGFNQAINGLSGNGVIDGNCTLYVGNNNASGTFSGAINDTTGTLTLVKVGSGNYNLYGLNTYTGTTTINGGSLTLTNNNSLGLGTSAILSNNTKIILSGDNLTIPSKNYNISNSIGGVASIENTGTNNILLGNITIGEGSNNYRFLCNDNSSLIISGNSFNTTSLSTDIFSMQGNGTITIYNNIKGNSQIQKSAFGIGNLILAGNNTFDAPVSIRGGSLSVYSINSVVGGTLSSNLGTPSNSTNGAISLDPVLSSIKFIYLGNGETTDRIIKLGNNGYAAIIEHSGNNLLKFTSDMLIASTGSRTFILQGSTSGPGEFAGNIIDYNTSNKTNLLKAGTGTWVLSYSANSFTGNTNISGGTLIVHSTNTSPTTIYTSGTLAGSGYISGSVTVNNNGTIYGGTTNNIGTLRTRDLIFSGTSAILNVYTNGTDNCSLIASSGNVSLGGLSANILGVINTGTYNLITASGVMSGTLPTLGTNLTTHTVSLSQAGNTLKMIVS